jgi:transposase
MKDHRVPVTVGGHFRKMDDIILDVIHLAELKLSQSMSTTQIAIILGMGRSTYYRLRNIEEKRKYGYKLPRINYEHNPKRPKSKPKSSE